MVRCSCPAKWNVGALVDGYNGRWSPTTAINICNQWEVSSGKSSLAAIVEQCRMSRALLGCWIDTIFAFVGISMVSLPWIIEGCLLLFAPRQ